MIAPAVQHRTRVRLNPLCQRNRKTTAKPWYARCSCGWKGHKWLSEVTAYQEGLKHERGERTS